VHLHHAAARVIDATPPICALPPADLKKLAVDFAGGNLSCGAGLLLRRQGQGCLGSSPAGGSAPGKRRLCRIGDPSRLASRDVHARWGRAFAHGRGYKEGNDGTKLGHDPAIANAVGPCLANRRPHNRRSRDRKMRRASGNCRAGGAPFDLLRFPVRPKKQRIFPITRPRLVRRHDGHSLGFLEHSRTCNDGDQQRLASAPLHEEFWGDVRDGPTRKE
jgi:hypothetical protein